MTTGSKSATKTQRGRAVLRRWFRFGPGLLLAVMAIWLVRPQLFPRNSAPPVIERTRLDTVRVDGVSALPASVPVSAPDPAWLLAQRDGLKLRPTQVQKLSRLHTRWQRDTRALREALENASTQFNRAMAEDANARRHVTMERLQERAGPISELSHQVSQARRAWWGEAAKVLSLEQRHQAEQAWVRRFSVKPVSTIPAAVKETGDRDQ